MICAQYQQGAIFKAVVGDVQNIDRQIKNGANVDERNEYGETPLIWAAHNGYKAAVDFLVAHNANVNHTARNGEFALFWAARSGHNEICGALLKAGADSNMKFQGKTAAQWAADKGHKELASSIESWPAVRIALLGLCIDLCFSSPLRVRSLQRELNRYFRLCLCLLGAAAFVCLLLCAPEIQVRRHHRSC